MMVRILITGGAGFIGSALARHLAECGGYQATVLDNLSPQIHGPDAVFSTALCGAADCIRGDVRNRGDVKGALQDQEIVVHLAAETGTGQSMYEIARYTSTNVGGTALLLEECGRLDPGIRKIVLASSRAVYGEGKYQCQKCGIVFPSSRDIEDMKAGDFEAHCPNCGHAVDPLPTDEEARMWPVSVYGSTKVCQEQLVTIWGQANDIETLALRFQNVYGPGQSLSNPYTGILSIFSGLILKGQKLDIYEDGRESRDFVYIDDVAESIRRAIESEPSQHSAFNVGTSKPATISEVAQLLMRCFGKEVSARVSGHFRAGDIRHNFATTDRCREELGFSARWALEDGLPELAGWVAESGGGASDIALATRELRSRNLLMKSERPAEEC